MQKLPTIQCDGSPVKGLVGIYSKDFGISESIKIGKGKTNNELEYCAVIQTLLLIRERKIEDELVLISDSQLVVKQLKGEWRVRRKHLLPYWNDAIGLLHAYLNVHLIWKPRKYVKQADALTR